MSDPTETARRVLDLDKQATQGPWRIYTDPKGRTFGTLYVLDPTVKPGDGCAVAADICDSDGGSSRENATLIAEYRTAAPDLARALLEAQAALAAAQEGVHATCGNRHGEGACVLETVALVRERTAERDEALSKLAAATEERDAAKEAEAAAIRTMDQALAEYATLPRVEAERDALRLELQAANARADAIAAEALAAFVAQDALRADLATARAEAETLRRERDEARGQMAVERRQRERCEQEIAEAATLRESVRELVDGLRFAKDHLVDTHDCDETTTIDALLAKHAAPAPTPARSPLDPPEKIGAEDMENPRPPKGTILDVNGKPTPAAVPGLVFGEPGTDGFRQARASDGQVYTVDRMAFARRGWFWCWIDGEPHVDEGYVDTESDAIAAANAHNAARLKGGE